MEMLLIRCTAERCVLQVALARAAVEVEKLRLMRAEKSLVCGCLSEVTRPNVEGLLGRHLVDLRWKVYEYEFCYFSSRLHFRLKKAVKQVAPAFENLNNSWN
jgi:hypothetical protein